MDSELTMGESTNKLKKVAILFSGGPAPAANAVISAAADSFLRDGIEVVGIKFGYSAFTDFAPDKPLEEGKHFINIKHSDLRRTRNSRGIMIGTARTNPGKHIKQPTDFDDDDKVEPMSQVYEALRSLGVDALVSIGGDDTLKTANKFKMYQERRRADEPRIAVVHLPKTIDNDYEGIDFTFGYFTAVNMLGEELLNLISDAESSNVYFLAECMGRSAGWLTYGAAIAGEASLVLSVEDIPKEERLDETYKNEKTGEMDTRKIMDLDSVVDRIVGTMLAREEMGKEYGVIVVAEGLAELLPMEYLEGVKYDEHNHLRVADANLHSILAKLAAERYKEKTERERLVKPVQLGYEVRCSKPNAFDAVLGSQLGFGAYRALVEKGRDGVMVSISGQLKLHYVEFENLVDPETLVTVVRYIQPGSDFHRLAHFLETGES